MCGIAGFFDPKFNGGKIKLKKTLTAMTDQIIHRGPDHGAAWIDENLPLALGHRRLSILDLTADGHQPMISHSGRYVIIFNGEFYNFKKVRSELEKLDHHFKGRSDTEVFLAACDQWGLNRAVQKFDGMFAFALWDREERELHFIRDRLGKKPLYVGWAKDGALIFGSELKALRAYPAFEPQLDQNVLGQYLQFGCVHAPHCIYQNIYQLPAGFRLSVKPEQIKGAMNLTGLMKPYWQATSIIHDARQAKKDISFEEASREFEELLEQAVAKRMISDVPLGSFLSGGIDSSAVTALMQKQSPGRVKTYTIGFDEADFNEATYAKDIAAHLGTDHHEQYLSGRDALDMIPDLPRIYDEPFADISALPTYLLSRFTRGDVTVALSGDGGDELLGGYRRHIFGPKIWNKISWIPHPLRVLSSNIIRAVPDQILNRINPSKSDFHRQIHKGADILKVKNTADLYRFFMPGFDDPNEIMTQNPQALTTMLNHSDWALQKDLNLTEKLMAWDTISYLPNDILTKVDRAAMAVSLEVRAPLLDHHLFDFAWRLPINYKIKNGTGKLLLRDVLTRHVPAELFERPKQGFSIPVDSWLREELKDWASDLLDPQNLSDDGIFDGDAIGRLWHNHLNNNGNHAIQLWTILMFQAWKKEYL